MRIGIQTWGSEGDVRPFLALAAGLRSAGHDVTLAVTHVTNKDYTERGAAFGIPVRQVGHLATELPKLVGEVLINETNILKQVDVILRDLFDPAARDILDAAKRLCNENDLVIGHFLVHPLKTAAELADKPHIPVFLAPLLPSASFPPPGVPNLGRFMNSLLWRLGERIMNRMYLPRINKMRLDEGLLPQKSITGDAYLSPRLNLIASSPSLFPRPADWDATFQLCGAFHLPENGEPWQTPDNLNRFLAAGPPPLYMTFGSMSVGDPSFGQTLRLFAQSARLAGCRAVIQTNDFDPGDGTAAPDIFYISRAEHAAVFPRCAAVVHHGGAGTSHAASRAGRPSIVVEHATDQVFWGGVLRRAGIAPRLLHRRTVTAPVLARAIRSALSSSAMNAKARAIGERMRREDGVRRAIELIEGQRWDIRN